MSETHARGAHRHGHRVHRAERATGTASVSGAASPQGVLETLSVVLAGLSYPARTWQIIIVAESYGADAVTLARLRRLPVASFRSIGHVAHAVLHATDTMR